MDISTKVKKAQCSGAKAGHKSIIFQPRPPKHWVNRHAQPHQALLLSLGMDFLMVLKAGTVTEAFPTCVTFLRLLSSVNSLVCLKT